jgi:hypothetical protein
MKYKFVYFFFVIAIIIFFVIFNNYTKESVYKENFRSRSQWSGFHAPGFRM